MHTQSGSQPSEAVDEKVLVKNRNTVNLLVLLLLLLQLLGTDSLFLPFLLSTRSYNKILGFFFLLSIKSESNSIHVHYICFLLSFSAHVCTVFFHSFLEQQLRVLCASYVHLICDKSTSRAYTYV